MLKKIHIRLTFFCAMAIGIILLVMTTFCLIISEWGIRNKNYTSFQNNANSLLTYMADQDVLSHTWLSQMEYNYHMIIDIRDGTVPLLYSRLHADEETSLLLTQVRKTASSQYGLSAQSFDASRTLSRQQSFCTEDASGQEYFAMAAFLPRENGYLDIAVLSPSIQSGSQIIHQRILFSLGAFISWIILVFCAFIFIKKMLMPIEQNRKNQAEFIASASHELRSPLTVMLSSLSAARTADTEQQSLFFDAIETEGHRMNRLIQDMLTLAGSDNHTWSIQSTKAEMDTLLLDLYEKYELLAKEKGLHLKVSLPDSPIPCVICDKERIVQALSILIENALIYTPAGGKVTLNVIFSEKNCIFQIIDNGPGVPDKEKEKIFERFYRSDSSHKDKDHFGLGLCIAKEISLLHKGSILVKDAPGGGSIFEFILPY